LIAPNFHDNPLKEDLDHVLAHTEGLWEEMRGKKVFITGGWANYKLDLGASAFVLSRSPEAFEKRTPHLCRYKAIKFLRGDIKDFVFPEESFSYLIHGSVYQQCADETASNLFMVNEMLKGTMRVLDFCVRANVEKMLLVSTGAVYGEAPPQLKNIPESFSDSTDPTVGESAYHHVRRMMETLSVIYAEENNFEAKIARCFSFIGPYMPLNGRFAVGDFILDALFDNSLTIRGDGKAVRSYLYMADLAVWLWTVLLKGKSGRPYNVGSELPITIREIAEAIANESVTPLSVSILKESSCGVAQDHYVPDTSRAQFELNLQQRIFLPTAIKKTIQWYRNLNLL